MRSASLWSSFFSLFFLLSTLPSDVYSGSLSSLLVFYFRLRSFPVPHDRGHDVPFLPRQKWVDFFLLPFQSSSVLVT